MSTSLKTKGFLVVLFGFLWIMFDCVTGFTEFQYSYWWRRSGELPAGETIKRDRAIGAMRDISLRLNDRHRVILLPALMMLSGSIVMLFAGGCTRGAAVPGEPGGPANGSQPSSSVPQSTPEAAGSRR